jgi:hypothetical protein
MDAHENILSTLDLFAFISAAFFLISRGRSAGESISTSSSSTAAPAVVAVVVLLETPDRLRRGRSERMKVWKFLDLGSVAGADDAATGSSYWVDECVAVLATDVVLLIERRENLLECCAFAFDFEFEFGRSGLCCWGV